MAINEFTSALYQVAAEKKLKPEEVIDSIKEAVLVAYKKDHVVSEEDDANLSSKVDENTGEIRILLNKKDVTPAGFGRIAAQAAKQVIFQKIREAEKNSMIQEYKEKVGTIVQGYIFRIDKDGLVLDLGKAQGFLPNNEKVPSERYNMNQKLKVLVKDIVEGIAPKIVLSRKDPKFILALFEQEVPEIASGVVTIERIAREPGSRTKIAVSSKDSKIDPSGACIGQKGSRVQAVTDELNGEKVDIVNYNIDPDKFIAAALSPATVLDVTIDNDTRQAFVKVADDHLSLAIGAGGQNARLAAKLAEYGININGTTVDDGSAKSKKDDDDTKNDDSDADDSKEAKAK